MGRALRESEREVSKHKKRFSILHTETFAKFLLPPDSRNLIKDFRLFLFQISTDSTQIPPLNPPWIPDNQASGPPFRQQQAHLAC